MLREQREFNVQINCPSRMRASSGARSLLTDPVRGLQKGALQQGGDWVRRKGWDTGRETLVNKY